MALKGMSLQDQYILTSFFISLINKFSPRCFLSLVTSKADLAHHLAQLRGAKFSLFVREKVLALSLVSRTIVARISSVRNRRKYTRGVELEGGMFRAPGFRTEKLTSPGDESSGG